MAEALTQMGGEVTEVAFEPTRPDHLARLSRRVERSTRRVILRRVGGP